VVRLLIMKVMLLGLLLGDPLMMMHNLMEHEAWILFARKLLSVSLNMRA